MKIINLTPHTINILWELCWLNGSPSGHYETLAEVEPSGQVARVTSKTVKVDDVEIDGFFVPVTGTTYGEVEGLPAPEEGTIYIVSSLVASRVPNRTDVFIPNESVRDDKGRIVGCKSLGRV